MSNVTGGASPNISITQTGPLGVNPSFPLPAGVLNLRGQFGTSGTGAGQFALVHARTYSFAASTPQLIDLLSLLDPTGAAIAFSVVRFFAYRIQSAIAAYILTVGGAASNPWNGWLVGAGQEVWQPSTASLDGYAIRQAPSAAGMAVNSTSHVLLLDPGANAVGAVDIIIAGS